MSTRRRLTDQDVEAILGGRTPADRPDLAATAAFVRELPAQLSESESIELTAPPRRRTRWFVAAAAVVVAVAGLAGLVALRHQNHVLRPALAGESSSAVAAPTTSPAASTTVSPQARYEADLAAWTACVTDKGADACGPKPDPSAYGLTPVPTTTACSSKSDPRIPPPASMPC